MSEKTVINYPTGAPTDEWTKVGAATAWEATDDDGVTTDYIQVTGFAAGKKTVLTFDAVPSTLKRLTRIKIVFYAYFNNQGTVPGILIEYFIGAEKIMSDRRSIDNADYAWFVVDIPNLDYTYNELQGLTRKVEFTPLDGGYLLEVIPGTG